MDLIGNNKLLTINYFNYFLTIRFEIIQKNTKKKNLESVENMHFQDNIKKSRIVMVEL